MRLRPAPPLTELIPRLLETITSTTDTERSFLPFKHDGKDEVVLLLNNLGGISELELANIAGETVSALEKMKINVARLLAGTYMVRLSVALILV
jgi:triose/dihydroxyacetone kinase / FAD-AMP lyase (cyclizing)